MDEDNAEKVLSITDEIILAYGEASSKKECVNSFVSKYGISKRDIVNLLLKKKQMDAMAIRKYIRSGYLPEMSDDEVKFYAKPRLTREQNAKICGFSGKEKTELRMEEIHAEEPKEEPVPVTSKSDPVQDALIVAATKYLEEHNEEYLKYSEVVHTCENLMQFIGGAR